MTIDRTSLAGKVALVTGGSRGIGKSIAAALGRAGARVTIVSRKEASVTAAREELVAAGVDASGLAINVSNLSDLATIITHVTSTRSSRARAYPVAIAAPTPPLRSWTITSTRGSPMPRACSAVPSGDASSTT